MVLVCWPPQVVYFLGIWSWVVFDHMASYLMRSNFNYFSHCCGWVTTIDNFIIWARFFLILFSCTSKLICPISHNSHQVNHTLVVHYHRSTPTPIVVHTQTKYNMIPKMTHQPKSKELTCKQQNARIQV